LATITTSLPPRHRLTIAGRALRAHPDATLVAGATDVGLWVTKQLRDLPKIIHLGRVAGFDNIDDSPTRW
jgi:xanthine dehydrogenase iron-sulfur cluster and FAD-binding subunit A